MWARSSKLALSRLTFHYQTVNTISAYPSLSEGDLDNKLNKCKHDRRSWRYLGLSFIIKHVNTISAYPSLSEGDLLEKNWNECGHDCRSSHYLGLPCTIEKDGPTFAKLTFCEVALVQFRAMWALSEVNWATIEQSWHYRKWIWNKF